jgi:hypothetical protein
MGKKTSLSIMRMMTRLKRVDMRGSVCPEGLFVSFPKFISKNFKKNSFPILKSSSIYTILTVVAPITTIPIQRISSKMPVPQETSPYKSFLTRGHYPFSGMRNTAHLMASGLFDKGIAKHVSDNNLSVVIKSDYLDSNSVFFTLSIELCFALGIPNAFVVMVTMPFWMILSSFESNPPV